MELTLPTKVNVTHPIMLDTKILVVIGANGAGKSSFGRDLLERYAGQAKRISGIHALFIRYSKTTVMSSSTVRSSISAAAIASAAAVR